MITRKRDYKQMVSAEGIEPSPTVHEPGNKNKWLQGVSQALSEQK
jgi:hypothetical protein